MRLVALTWLFLHLTNYSTILNGAKNSSSAIKQAVSYPCMYEQKTIAINNDVKVFAQKKNYLFSINLYFFLRNVKMIL